MEHRKDPCIYSRSSGTSVYASSYMEAVGTGGMWVLFIYFVARLKNPGREVRGLRCVSMVPVKVKLILIRKKEKGKCCKIQEKSMKVKMMKMFNYWCLILICCVHHYQSQTQWDSRRQWDRKGQEETVRQEGTVGKLWMDIAVKCCFFCPTLNTTNSRETCTEKGAASLTVQVHIVIIKKQRWRKAPWM